MIYVAAPGDTFYSALFANVVTVTHFGVMARVVSGNISLMFLFHSLVEVLCGDDELRQPKTRHEVRMINGVNLDKIPKNSSFFFEKPSLSIV